MNQDVALLSNEDSLHIIRVLRKGVGDKLEVVSDGRLFLGEVNAIGKKQVEVTLLEELPVTSEPEVRITLFQGLAKGNRMDYAVQKAAEIGVYKVIPVEMERSVKKGSTTERWNRISYEACKQCKRVYVPKVENTIELSQINVKGYDLFLVPYEMEEEGDLKTLLQQHRDVQSVGILIGPEGGISGEEIEQLLNKGALSVTLGKRILRTETAGLVCAAAVLYEMGEMA